MRALLAALGLLVALAAGAAEARSGGESRAAAAANAENAVVSEALSGLAEAVQERVGPTELTPRFQTWNAEADRARDVIENNVASNNALEIMRERLVTLRSEAQELVTRQRARLEPLSRELAALGPAPSEGQPLEEPALAALRERLRDQISEENAALAAAQLAVERFNVLLEDLSSVLSERLRLRVMTRGPSPLSPAVWAAAADDLAQLASDIRSEAHAELSSPASQALALERAPISIAALAASFWLFVWGRRKLARWSLRAVRDPDISEPRRLARGVAATAARLGLLFTIAFLLFFGIVAVSFFGLKAEVLIDGASRGVLFVIVTFTLATAYFAPDAPELRLAGLPDKAARKARSAAMILAWVTALGAAVVYALRTLRIDEDALIMLVFGLCVATSIGLLRLRSAYASLDVAAAPEASQTQERDVGDSEDEEPPEEAGKLGRQIVWLFRHLLLLVAVAAPALSATGYFAAAYELIAPSLRSLGVIGLCALLFAFARRIADAAAERADDYSARIWRLTPLFSAILLILLSAPLFAVAWGASWADVVFAARRFFEGAEVGGVALSPVGALTFAAVFGVGYALTQLVKRLLRTQVMPQLQVEIGARSALESGVGYIGVILAALLAITAAGLDLSNLAIVAGALSVGVGFGLQTVVNNFVSGLILLIERPIRVGDWIEVNGVHGTVKKVNVRSTEIETFDRSDYIVPNADLVASPVTNYTRRNALGRLIVKVGVAYASDPRQVERILRKVAQDHPFVLRRPEPMILFRAFGADALEFEIRAYLRDVNYIMKIGSDLHFAVAEKFREAGIEIPFGQRDIWFRNPEALGEALRGAPSPEPPAEAAPPRAEAAIASAAAPDIAARGAAS